LEPFTGDSRQPNGLQALGDGPQGLFVLRLAVERKDSRVLYR
jgi:hypothetical protein